MHTTKNKSLSLAVPTSGKYCLEISKTFSFTILTFLFTFLMIDSFAQSVKDTTDRRFHDDLLDHLVGNWHVTSIAHGSRFTSVVDAKWVLNHQYLLIHLKSNEIIPWWQVRMEYYEYIGYNHTNNRYIVHGMSIEGDEDPSEGHGYAYRKGNELKIVMKFGEDSFVVQRHTWQPSSNSWHVESRWEIAGKEGEVFLEMNFVAATPSTKSRKTGGK